MYEETTPSEVPRPSRFAAEAWPLTRRISIARSTSPSASVSAALLSIMPAPVRSRSAFTSAAETAISPRSPARNQGQAPARSGRNHRRPLLRLRLRERPGSLHPAEGPERPSRVGSAAAERELLAAAVPRAHLAPAAPLARPAPRPPEQLRPP